MLFTKFNENCFLFKAEHILYFEMLNLCTKCIIDIIADIFTVGCDKSRLSAPGTSTLVNMFQIWIGLF